jgi:hypothetical protein
LLRAVFAKPVKRAAQLEDAAAVRLDVSAAIVRPDIAGMELFCG